jgi:hypothetical protein
LTDVIAPVQRRVANQARVADRAGLLNFDTVSVSHEGAQYGYRYRKRLSTMFVVSRDKP